MSLPTRDDLQKMNINFLVSPTIRNPDYKPIPFDTEKPRAIPFPDGHFGDNKFITISENGKKITFDMQQGSILDVTNGTIVEAIIQYAKEHLVQVNQGALANRFTSMAITDLDNASLHLFARYAERDARAVLGTYKK
jgi:hypothetical protein